MRANTQVRPYISRVLYNAQAVIIDDGFVIAAAGGDTQDDPAGGGAITGIDDELPAAEGDLVGGGFLGVVVDAPHQVEAVFAHGKGGGQGDVGSEEYIAYLMRSLGYRAANNHTNIPQHLTRYFVRCLTTKTKQHYWNLSAPTHRQDQAAHMSLIAFSILRISPICGS